MSNHVKYHGHRPMVASEQFVNRKFDRTDLPGTGGHWQANGWRDTTTHRWNPEKNEFEGTKIDYARAMGSSYGGADKRSPDLKAIGMIPINHDNGPDGVVQSLLDGLRGYNRHYAAYPMTEAHLGGLVRKFNTGRKGAPSIREPGRKAFEKALEQDLFPSSMKPLVQKVSENDSETMQQLLDANSAAFYGR